MKKTLVTISLVFLSTYSFANNLVREISSQEFDKYNNFTTPLDETIIQNFYLNSEYYFSNKNNQFTSIFCPELGQCLITAKNFHESKTQEYLFEGSALGYSHLYLLKVTNLSTENTMIKFYILE